VNFQLDDTIGALASAPGSSGRGIVRVSGPQALACIAHCFEPADSPRWQEARAAAAHRGFFRLPEWCSPIPVLVYRWPQGRSYTGQLSLEIHAPGSPPVLEAILAELFRHGVRPASPGEFTARAFLSGRIDLVQAEAVLGVIDADDQRQLSRALSQLAGGVSGRITRVRHDLIDLLADLEAGLDFAEEHIEFVSGDEVGRRIAAAQSTIGELRDACRDRAQSHARRRVVLSGLPNAGKSTLFNALLSQEAALVSSIAGTTRDYLCGQVEWQGLPVELVDTPGWQSDRDAVMQQAHALLDDQCARADLIVWCHPCDGGPHEEDREAKVLSEFRRQNRPLLVLRTKGDLLDPKSREVCPVVSARTGQGLSEVVRRCAAMLDERESRPGELVGTTAARCRESLFHTSESLVRARLAAESQAGDELVALELRESLEHLGRILGTIYTDDILDRIFSRFCIGK
jgi:tRNA modification GTPase